MKSRILVWGLVGIIVIVGVIVILTSPKNTRGPKVTPEIVKTEVGRAETQLDRLVTRLDSRKKAAAPGASAEAFAEADRLLAEARDKLDQAKQAADLDATQQLLIEARQVLRKARRAVQLATKPTSRPPGAY